jgi:iron-sulfur cluster assembly accessory protein
LAGVGPADAPNHEKGGWHSMVTLSDVAAEKLRAILVEEKAEEKGLRIRVVPGGCLGFSYDMIFDDKVDGDQVFEAGGVRLLVDGESLPLLEGATIDFKEEIGHEGFTINNPNAKSGCGCGKSFQT